MDVEHRRKIGMSLRNRIITPEWRKKISETLKQNPVNYWEGKKRDTLPQEWKDKISKALTGIKRSKRTREKISIAMSGKKHHLGFKHSEQTKHKIGEANAIKLAGRKLSESTKKKISDALKGKYVGEKNVHWRGGGRKDRYCTNHINWRGEVLKRDNYTCVLCKQVGGKLEVHHIVGWADYPQERFKIENGITLCRNCHKKTDNFGTKKSII